MQGHVHVPLSARVLGTFPEDAVAPGQGWAQQAGQGQEQERHSALLQEPDRALELWLAPDLALGL